MNKPLFAKVAVIASLAALGTFAASANAATATATFNVTLVIQRACSVTAANLDFGSQAVGTSTTVLNQTTTGSVTVTCTKNTPFTIGLAPSTVNNGGTASTNGQGNMAAQNVAPISGNTDKVAYALFQDSTHATPWGNTAGTNLYSGKGNATGTALTAIPVYATATNTNVTPDSYSDTVTVNVNY